MQWMNFYPVDNAIGLNTYPHFGFRKLIRIIISKLPKKYLKGTVEVNSEGVEKNRKFRFPGGFEVTLQVSCFKRRVNRTRKELVATKQENRVKELRKLIPPFP